MSRKMGVSMDVTSLTRCNNLDRGQYEVVGQNEVTRQNDNDTYSRFHLFSPLQGLTYKMEWVKQLKIVKLSNSQFTKFFVLVRVHYW